MLTFRVKTPYFATSSVAIADTAPGTRLQVAKTVKKVVSGVEERVSKRLVRSQNAARILCHCQTNHNTHTSPLQQLLTHNKQTL